MDELERIEKYLNDHDVYPEYVDSDILDAKKIMVQINHGDWKHEHLYCNVLMDRLGYINCGESTTEEDGSDCYSALHYYERKGGRTNGRETTENNRVRRGGTK